MTSNAVSQSDVRKSLVALIAPMVLSLLFIGSTNVVDAVFVARLGSDALTAFGFAAPVITLLFQIQVAFGVGVTSVVARAVGAGDRELARRLTLHAGVSGLVLTIVLGGLVKLCQDWLFVQLGASGEQLSLAIAFMDAWILGMPVYFLVIWGTAAMRGVGNAKASALAFMTQAAVNWISVPLLTFGVGSMPGLGIRGAGIGSVIAYAVASLAVLRGLVRGDRLVGADLTTGFGSSLRAILAVAVPAILTYVLAPVTSGIITALLAKTGGHAVAAYSVVSRVFDGFLSMVPLAIGSGLGPFVGQAWGAKRLDPLREGVALCRRAALLWGLGCYALGALFAGPLAKLFSGDAALTPMITVALRVLPLGFASYGMLTVTNSVYNGVGRAGTATILALIRTVGLSVPLAFLAARFLGHAWLFGAVAASSIVADLLGARWLTRDGLRPRGAAAAPAQLGAQS